jgi:hypothetical protein
VDGGSAACAFLIAFVLDADLVLGGAVGLVMDGDGFYRLFVVPVVHGKLGLMAGAFCSGTWRSALLL